mmetsp:Transcript_51455/g.122357  ORF Transcript_51455/g.122357 Transcript_51455/m.122357 type:complete len:216 (+) Transcript_51455:106-753(+)
MMRFLALLAACCAAPSAALHELPRMKPSVPEPEAHKGWKSAKRNPRPSASDIEPTSEEPVGYQLSDAVQKAALELEKLQSMTTLASTGSEPRVEDLLAERRRLLAVQRHLLQRTRLLEEENAKSLVKLRELDSQSKGEAAERQHLEAENRDLWQAAQKARQAQQVASKAAREAEAARLQAATWFSAQLKEAKTALEKVRDAGAGSAADTKQSESD